MSVGFEAELFIINSAGELKPKADEVIAKASHENIIHKPVKEYAKEVVEINAFPAEIVEAAVLDYINAFYELDDIVRGLDLYLMPMALYPGKYTPITRNRESPYYGLKEKIFGKRWVMAAARATSFHFHYPMPEDKEKLVELYNFFVALVPFFDLVLQSSPYYMARLFAKDGRAFIYRDTSLGEVEGAYKGFELFGGLASYTTGFDELVSLIAERRRRWLSLASKHGVDLKGKELLDYYWGTVRLNKVGTIELRSPDINLPSYLLEAIYFFKKACDLAMEKHIKLSDVEGEAFKLEGEALIIPPMTAVRKASYEASLKGFESPNAYAYAKSLLDIVDEKREFPLLRNMFDEKKSFADEIIIKAEKLGYKEELPKEAWEELSLYVAERALSEAEEVKRKATALLSQFSSTTLTHGKLVEKIIQYIGEEKAQPIDLSRKSPSRLKQVKAVILSPYFKRHTTDIEKLCEEFLLISFHPLKCGKHINVEFKEGWHAIAKGLIKLVLEANNIKESEALFVAKAKDDIPLMSHFGISATFHNAPREVKDKADLLIHSLKEIIKFTRGL